MVVNKTKIKTKNGKKQGLSPVVIPKKSSFKLQSVPVTGKKTNGKTNGKGNSKSNGKTNGKETPTLEYKDAMETVRAGRGYQPFIQPVKMGRPTKYKEEYCDMLIEHMARGNPIETFAAVAHVTVDTVHEWVKVHPEFSVAKRIGKPLQLAWWLELGKALTVDDPSYQLELLGVKPFLKKHTVRRVAGTEGEPGMVDEIHEYHVPRGNTGTFCYIMNNMFRSMGWRNPQQIEHSGPGGGPIKTESKSLALVAELPTEDLRALNRILTNATALTQPDEEV